MKRLETFAEKKALVQQLNLEDDVFFEKAVEDKEVCEEMLRVILAMPELKIVGNEPQKFIRNIGTKSVILDLCCQDATGRIFNVEMQKSNNDDHLRRVRYYCSNLDTLSTEQGIKYEELPDMYMVYITKTDFLKGQKPIYHVKRTLAETGDIVYNGINEIYVNTAVYDGTDVAELMRLFRNSNYYDVRFPKVSSRINFLKEEFQGVTNVCEVVEKYAAEAYKEEFDELAKKIADKDAVIADKDAAIADKDAEIAELKRKLAELSNQH